MNKKEMPGPRTRTPGDKAEQTKYNTGRIEIQELLPHNSDAEIELIENLIFRPDKVDLASGIVAPEDFYSRLRSQVYERILEFHITGCAWNLITLEDSFRGDPNSIKYRDFFDSLLPYIGERVGPTAQIIKECADRRKLIAATNQANSDLFGFVGISVINANLHKVFKEVA